MGEWVTFGLSAPSSCPSIQSVHPFIVTTSSAPRFQQIGMGRRRMDGWTAKFAKNSHPCPVSLLAVLTKPIHFHTRCSRRGLLHFTITTGQQEPRKGWLVNGGIAAKLRSFQLAHSSCAGHSRLCSLTHIPHFLPSLSPTPRAVLHSLQSILLTLLLFPSFPHCPENPQKAIEKASDACFQFAQAQFRIFFHIDIGGLFSMYYI